MLYYYPDVLSEGDTPVWSVPVTKGGVAVPLADVDSITLTLEDQHGNVVNGRDEEDALNANETAFSDTTGILTWTGTIDDTQLADDADAWATHLATWTFSLTDAAGGQSFDIRLLMRVRRDVFSSAVTRYVPPDVAQIRTSTRVTPVMTGQSDDEFGAALMSLLEDAETETALQVDAALWDSTTLGGAQAKALNIAVRLRAGAALLRGIASEKVTNAEEPQDMEAADAIRAQADALDMKAATFDLLVKGQPAEELPPSSAAQRVTGRARMGLVTPLPVTVRPSERIADLDEREDLAAGQLVRRGG